jgi:hypothetical protein
MLRLREDEDMHVGQQWGSTAEWNPLPPPPPHVHRLALVDGIGDEAEEARTLEEDHEEVCKVGQELEPLGLLLGGGEHVRPVAAEAEVCLALGEALRGWRGQEGAMWGGT